MSGCSGPSTHRTLGLTLLWFSETVERDWCVLTMPHKQECNTQCPLGGPRQWAAATVYWEKHHKPCVNFLPCLAEQPNVLKSRIICIMFINFTLRSVRWAWPQLPDAWGSWSGPYRWCQWTRQSLSPQSGLGEGQPLWAVGSIQSKTYLLPWRSYLSTASLWVSQSSIICNKLQYSYIFVQIQRRVSLIYYI